MEKLNIKIEYIKHSKGIFELICNNDEWENPFEVIGVLNHVLKSIEMDISKGEQKNENNVPFSKEMQVDDFVRCERLNKQDRHNSFMIGKVYLVVDVDKDYRGKTYYYIIDDNNKKRKYYQKNRMFKRIPKGYGK